MTREPKVEFLQRVPLFHGIEPELVENIAKIMTLTRFTADQFLCHKGEPGDACYILGKGQVRVLTQSENGNQLCTLGPGHVIGELALLDGRPRSASLQAKEEVTAFVLEREDFSRLLLLQNKGCMRLLDNIVQAIAMRVRIVNDQYIEMFSRPGETIEKLVSQMRSLQSIVAGGEQETGDTDDLIRKFGDIEQGLPSSN